LLQCLAWDVLSDLFFSDENINYFYFDNFMSDRSRVTLNRKIISHANTKVICHYFPVRYSAGGITITPPARPRHTETR
jgi:hypothetical protein